MEKLKVAVVGTGSIAQIVHIPLLKKLENVELVAICDVDQGKVSFLTQKFNIPRWYYLIDEMISNEKLDAIHICTPSLYHYPMAYLALSNGVNVFIEKPVALNHRDALKLSKLAEEKKLTLMVGMHNRFRDDVKILKDFLNNSELGDIFYIKTGWLKKWTRNIVPGWHAKKSFAGGGVLIDIGIQLIDLAMFLLNLPKIKKVRLFDYRLNPEINVEDAALAVIETESRISITIEVSWRMHLERDTIYTHIFGKQGSAYLNPLRINKELHGNLVNVTPMLVEQNIDQFKKAYENELVHFVDVINGDAKNMSSAGDAVYVMQILDALYESAKTGAEISLE